MLDANMYRKRGIKDNRRLISLSKIKSYVNQNINCCKASQGMFVDGLLRMHTLTGCDTVSAFAGKGREKAMNIFKKGDYHISTLSELGNCRSLPEELTRKFEEFVCWLYGDKMSDVKIGCDTRCIGKSKPDCLWKFYHNVFHVYSSISEERISRCKYGSPHSCLS